MTALLRAEALKLWTVRSFRLIAAAVLAYPPLALLPAVGAGEDPVVGGDALAQLVRGGSDVLRVAVLLLGIALVTAEHRHGTIVPTMLAVPRRARLVAAKLLAAAAVGAGLGLAVAAVAVATGLAFLASRGVGVEVQAADGLLTAGTVALVGATYAVVGAALGAVVRNQVVAVAGALGWVLAVEGVVPIVLRRPGFRHWLPGGAGDRLLHLVDPVAGTPAAWQALAVLTAVGAALVAAAVAVTRRADVDLR